jgi:acyl-CoA reductase-like NAD-dependent aldehyde dehydrogenase
VGGSSGSQRTPFYGKGEVCYKQSGFGRELGAQAMNHYTETKSAWMQL